ncbi:helix-turn-helix transcriptional regulator [Microbispora hainanensis]|uniref:helix-turn-helix domain-containing protein n=1 Tax=Microbispora hainanensis TaxID=568844 RepID=UPI002E2A7A31|nr:helix-turn-helix transcriptional regulator [Microbispora hainanensis]
MVSDEVSPSQLGHRLAQLRDQAGIKQAELARSITWSQAVLSRVEAGERAVSAEELQAILKAIGTEEAAGLAHILSRKWTMLPRPALDHPDQQLLWEAEQRARELDDLARKPHAHPAFQTRLGEYINEIRHLAELLLRRDHLIAFIGAIGIGKSTAICRVTGLEIEDQAGRHTVLETAGGGTTLCEVHLKVGPGHGIRIEPRTEQEIRACVEDFADLFFKSDQPEDANDPSEGVSRELARAIRNMAGLVRPPATKGPDGKRIKTPDPAKVLAEEYTEKRDFVVEVLTRMNLPRRDLRAEWWGPSKSESPLEWLKTTFEDINNGRHPAFSLPARIELVVPELLPVAGLNVSVVDTRGIDGPGVRADLEAQLENPHTVSILCSGFNAAPDQNVQDLLRRAREISNSQIDSHAGILVLPRPGEALAVKDESGLRVESSEDGYEIKAEQITAALTQYQLAHLPVHFFNALEDDPEDLKKFVHHCVNATRARFQQKLRDVLNRAESLLENAEKEQVREIQRAVGRYVSAWIDQKSDLGRIRANIPDPLFAEIRRAYASSVHAAARRKGEWHSLSYSHHLGFGARKMAVDVLQDKVAAITDYCNTESTVRSEAEELLLQTARLIASGYEELLRKMQQAGVSLFGSELQQESTLWGQCTSEWGRGPGYRDRVLEHTQEWFGASDRQDLEDRLEEMLRTEWEALLRRINSIFELSDD